MEHIGFAGTFLTTFAVALVGAVVPVVNAEIYLLAASALLPRHLALTLVLAAALGQMVGKVAMYFAGRGALHLPWARFQRLVTRARERYHGSGADDRALGGALIFLSASLGIPPLYIISVAAGMFGVSLPLFFLVGMAGRVLRFSVVVLVPQLFRL